MGPAYAGNADLGSPDVRHHTPEILQDCQSALRSVSPVPMHCPPHSAPNNEDRNAETPPHVTSPVTTSATFRGGFGNGVKHSPPWSMMNFGPLRITPGLFDFASGTVLSPMSSTLFRSIRGEELPQMHNYALMWRVCSPGHLQCSSMPLSPPTPSG